MNSRKQHILFVHIPKTAGTSFRLAAQKYFGDESTLYDYGIASTETSENILKYVYEEKDMYKLSQKIQKQKKLFLSGHFHVAKYMSMFETLNVITFVRNPLEQVVSHFEHFKKYNNYKYDLVHFVKEERFKNLQFKALQAKPLELFGFIGLTEKYQKSIEMINDYYKINLEILSYNINRDKVLSNDKLDKSLKKLIFTENQKDFALYEKVEKIFFDRLKCFEEKESYKHIFIQEKTDKKIRGIAIEKDNNEPVEVLIKNNGKNMRIEAKELRGGLLAHGLPRNGYVGFNYILKDDV